MLSLVDIVRACSNVEFCHISLYDNTGEKVIFAIPKTDCYGKTYSCADV